MPAGLPTSVSSAFDALPVGPLPSLENGDQLTAREFLRRYEAAPGLKKAELIEGIVYMPSPIRLTQHARPDGIILGWLAAYEAATPGTQFAPNVTTRLDPDNVPQPDSMLRLLPECGGRTSVDADGYLVGPPELIVEIAASSASIDVRDKLRAYRRAGVREYLVWRTMEARIDWLALENDDYCPIPLDSQGFLRSSLFPGLWLNVAAALADDLRRVLETVHAGLDSPEHAEFVRRLQASRKT